MGPEHTASPLGRQGNPTLAGHSRCKANERLREGRAPRRNERAMSTTPTTNPSNKTLLMLLGVGGGIILLCSGLLISTLLVMNWGRNPKKDPEIEGKPNKGRPNSGLYKGPESNTLTASEAAQAGW